MTTPPEPPDDHPGDEPDEPVEHPGGHPDDAQQTQPEPPILDDEEPPF